MWKILGIGVVILAYSVNKTQGCIQKNTSCNHIKTEGGFKFPLNCHVGDEVFVSHKNQTIAHGTAGTQPFKKMDKVLKVDNDTIVTSDCEELNVKCIVSKGNKDIDEHCVTYKITEKLKNPDHTYDSSPPWGLIIGGAVLAVGVIIGLIWLICSYVSWKKRQRRDEFLRYLWTCSCLRKEEREGMRETRRPGGGEDQQVTGGEAAQPNGAIRMSAMSAASDPHGSVQNNNNQDGPLESVKVDSIDPNADGKTPQPSSLDHIQTNGAIQTTNNGDTSPPDVHRASYHRNINRGLRDDPGGVNNNGGVDAASGCEFFPRTRFLPSGCPLEDPGPEDRQDEETLLLSDQGAAIQDSDMTGEAVALVNKLGFDPGQDSGCSSATITDEESMSNMKTYNINIYG